MALILEFLVGMPSKATSIGREKKTSWDLLCGQSCFLGLKVCVTSARPACLYHYIALANENKLTSLYTSQACMLARVVLAVANCMYYNAYIYLLL